MNTTHTKVSIVGLGNVGTTAAYALTLSGIANELVLLARDKSKAYGEQLDLEHGIPFLETTSILATDNYADLSGSDVVIVTAGAAQAPGETRLDLAKKNIAIIEDIIPKVVEHAPDSVILIVSNPVDILTYKANQIAGLPHGKIFGSGTTLDTARFRMHLSQFLHVNPRSIHAYILGEHGDSSFPVISSASIGGQVLTSHPNFSLEQTMQSFEDAKQAAYKIIAAKGATYYAIGVVIKHIVKAILRDGKTVMPVSVPLTDYYGINDVSLSVPCIVGKNGVEQVLTVALDEKEQASLQNSAQILRAALA
jgi:L-lactate dehydrogenase